MKRFLLALFFAATASAARVDGQGNVLDVPNLALPDIGNAWTFWDGREYVVAGSNGKHVRISAAGELPDPAPRIATNGFNFLVVGNPCDGNCHLTITSLDREGAVIRHNPSTTSHAYQNVALASGAGTGGAMIGHSA